MLMAVQFPRDLVVANHREVKKRNFEPRIERRPLVVYAVEMPVDFRAVIEGFVSEQIKTVLADRLRLAPDSLRLIGQMSPQQFGALACCARSEKELPLRRGCSLNSSPLRTHSHSVPQQVASLMDLLPATRANFFPIRVEQACQFVPC